MKQPQILFCDNHLLVLNKPNGMLTQPNHTSEMSLEAFGKEWIKRRFQKKGKVFCEAVHRIDRPISGIVLFARTTKALSRLQQSQREGKFEKYYQALVEGRLKQREERLEHHLVHGRRRAHLSDVSKLGTKRCVLKYRAVKEGKGYTLLHVTLETGRYHQIRAQLAAMGYPIIGDLKYGGKKNFPTLALHHGYLQVPHPISSNPTAWTARLFHDWPLAVSDATEWRFFQ